MKPPRPDLGQLSPRALSQVFDASPSAMLIVSRDGIIRHANTQADLLFGYEHGTLVGISVDALVPERFRPNHTAQRHSYFDRPVARAMGQGRDLHGLRADGSEVPIEIGLNPIDTGSSEVLALAAIIDLTQRRRSEDMLRASLAEKETLLREIHHRVKNNMQVVSSLLNLQSANISDPAQRALFSECQTRVRTMAMIHEQLYAAERLDNVDSRQYATELAQMLFASYVPTGSDIRLVLDIAEFDLDLESAIPFGLILHELITNALKHGFVGRSSGVLRVRTCRTDDGMQALRITDDGVGMPEQVRPDKSRGLGLRMVTTLTRQLDGHLTFERDAGTSCTVVFPRIRTP